MILPFVSFIC